MTARRILIVDDDVDCAASFADFLALHGYEVEEAFSGEEAISKYRERRFDLTFLDAKLPGIGGIEASTEIHRIDPDAPVILMTGFRLEQLCNQIVDTGTTRVLRRPHTAEEVLGALHDSGPKGIVLIADHDPAVVEAVRRCLGHRGHRALVGANGREVVDRAGIAVHDVLLLELQGPVVRGLEVYQDLKRHDRALPTIIITATSDEASTSGDRLRSVSVTGCLFKPFEPEQFLSVVEAIAR
jgi:CheY-like chemotaxis protein